MFKLNFSRVITPLLCTGLFLTLGACSSDGEERPEYLNTTSVKHLEVPPKLSVPDTSGALHLPEPSAKVQRAFSGGQTKNRHIAPAFKGISLKNDGQLYWLEIDMPVTKVWGMLPGFLAAEGIEVSRVEKLMGFVDTQWMNEYQKSYGDESSGGSWFGSFTPDYKDRFRLRVEAANKGSKSRLYVAHRGMQIVVTNDVSEWAQRESEAFLEREIMYRFMLFAGAGKQSATDLLAGYRSYQPRVIASKNKSSEFEVQGDKENVWRRLVHAMDRLGVDVKKSDKNTRTIKVLVGDLDIEKTRQESGGWFSGLFGGDVDVGDDEDYETTEYKKQEVAAKDKVIVNVQQIASANSSAIRLSLSDGDAVESGLALDFKNALFEQLK